MKRRYDQFLTPVLVGVLLVAGTAWALDFLLETALWGLGLDHLVGPRVPVPAVGYTSLRSLVFGLIEVAVLVAAWRPLWRLREKAREARARARRRAPTVDRAVTRGTEALRGVCSVLGTLVVLFFVLQPTLVMPWQVMPVDWRRRASQLVDGTASLALVDSVVWLARLGSTDPVSNVLAVDPASFHADLDADEIPLVDRWNSLLLAATDGDPELFAQTKALLWVESGGRQYAVSSTGCAGLMQFCASTAQRRPFRSVFGGGRVASCGCRDCGVPRQVQIELETDPSAVERHAEAFPCNLADARFDPDRSIRAGVVYVEELSAQVGGHLPLMYIGYNSGPRVSARLYAALGKPDDLEIEDLRPHLADALRPWYGSAADSRARGLLDVHLPKLMQAYQRFRAPK